MASQNTPAIRRQPNNTRDFTIIGGPSKFDLMVSLFDGNNHHRRTVRFVLKGIAPGMDVSIGGVQQEDGSGESWNFEGNVRLKNASRNWNVRGHYSTNDRHGHFKFIVPFMSQWDTVNECFVESIDAMEEKVLDEFLASIKERYPDYNQPRPLFVIGLFSV